MIEFDADVIKVIHTELEKSFPKMEKGIIPERESLLQSIIEKPDRILFGVESPYQDLISKAAVMMEAITRWHIFVDGNKRTGLMTAFLYLYLNQTYLAIPIDSVRFTIEIADTRETDPDSTNELIKKIADWLETHSTTKAIEFFGLVWIYNTWPALKLNILYRLGFRKRVKRTLNEWYALDTHPDYAEESKETSTFLQQIMRLATKNLYDSLKAQKKKSKNKR